MADAIKRKLLIGALLAWLPWIPAIVGLVYAFRGISNTKADRRERADAGSGMPICHCDLVHCSPLTHIEIDDADQSRFLAALGMTNEK
jgi:hypothetical protein